MARGRNVINTSISLEGGKEIVEMLKSMGDRGEAAAKQLERAFANASLGSALQTRINALKQSFAGLQEAGARIGKSFSNVASSFNDVSSAAATVRNRITLVAAAVTGIVIGFGAMAKSAYDSAGEIKDLSESLNVSKEDLQAFRLIAADIGLDFNDFSKGIVGITKGLEDIRDAAKDAKTGMGDMVNHLDKLSGGGLRIAEVFRKMGISLKETTSTMDVLKVLAGYFEKGATEAEKLGIAIDIFGAKLGPKMVRFLNQGAGAIDAFRKELQDMGLLLSDQMIETGDAAGDMITKLQLIFSIFKEKFFDLIAPAIVKGGQAIIDMLKANRAAIESWIKGAAERFVSVMGDIMYLMSGGLDGQVNNKWLLDIRDGFIAVKNAAFTFFYDILLPAFTKVREYADKLATAINSVFGTKFTGDGLLVAALVTKLVGGFGLLFSTIGLGINTVGLLFNVFRFGISVLGVLGTLWPVITGGLAAFIQWLPALAGLLGPGGLIAVAVVALGAVFYYFWDDIVAGAKATWEFLRTAFSTGWEAIKTVTSAAMQALATVLSETWDAIKQGASMALQGLAQMFSDIWSGITTAASTAFQGLAQVFSDVWEGMKSVASLARDALVQVATDTWAGITNTVAMARDGLFQAASQTWGAITEAAQGVANAVAPIWQSVSQFAVDTFNSIAGTIMQAWSGATQTVEQSAAAIQAAIQRASEIAGDVAGAQNIAAQLVQPFQQAYDRISQITSGFGALASNGMNAVADAVRSAASDIESEIYAIISALQRAAAEAARLRAQASGGGGGHAMGGYIRGPGSGTSDSIPAWLSNGEFVVRAAAVRKYGVDFLRAINGLRADRLFKGGFPAFAMGGPVSIPVPALSAAATASGRPVILSFGSETFSMTADNDVAERLIRYSAKRRVKSAGRKPSWYGA